MKVLNKLFAQYNNAAPGCSIAVAREGKIILKESYGCSDIKNNILNTSQTAFRLASLTKQFTAMVILMLWEKNKLKLDQKIKDFLPSLPEYADNITIRQLICHTSGIPDHEEPLYRSISKKDEPTIYDSLKVLEKESKTHFDPGSKQEYSNAGYVLLALIIENITQLTFREVITDYICNPLNMHNTLVVDEIKPFIPHRAFGYKKRENNYELHDYDQLNYIVGDEGIYSSVIDMCKWGTAWFNDILVSKKLLKKVANEQRLNNYSDINFGLGWFIKKVDGVKFLYHTGSWVGFNNIMILEPKSKTTVVFLSNTNDFPDEEDKWQIGMKILYYFYSLD